MTHPAWRYRFDTPTPSQRKRQSKRERAVYIIEHEGKPEPRAHGYGSRVRAEDALSHRASAAEFNVERYVPDTEIERLTSLLWKVRQVLFDGEHSELVEEIEEALR